MVAVNSAIQVDLTGQVCAESLGAHIYSGVGGQMDFMRGAALRGTWTTHHRVAGDGSGSPCVGGYARWGA